MNNSDCGCDGNSGNVDILQANNNINGNNMNGNIVNNVRQGNNNTKYINNMAQNQQNINNNPALNNMISSPPIEINNNKKEKTCNRDIRLFFYVLLALSINEMLKFFINQSIRLNKASSNRYLFYPIIVLALLVVVCLC